MSQEKIGTRELIALTVGGIIVVANVVYWIVQVIGVREMMKLANG